MVGVLALASAVAAGHLVAAFVGVNASPYVAVGNSAVALSPGWVKDFAIETFGSKDKIALLIGMAIVLVIIAALVGILSRRSPEPGTVFVVLFGLLGAAAVFTSSQTGPLALLAPGASLVAGVLVFRWLHRVGAGGTGAQQETAQPDGPPPPGKGRRQFLIGAGGVVAGAGISGIAGQTLLSSGGATASRAAVGKLHVASTAAPVPSDTAFTKLGTKPFITPNSDFYRVDTALAVPKLSTADWQLRIHGMVEHELTFDFDDIRNMPLIERTITMVCVSNPVGGPYISTSKFIGVELRELLNRAGTQPGAEQLFSTSTDGFTVGTPLSTVLEADRGALLAIGMNNEPLPFEHGFPARMVVPGLYGYVSATKWVVDMEITTWQARDPYWLNHGWAKKAPIKTESRIDQPAGFDTVAAGKVTVSGVAWHPHLGIDKVEVRLDNGPWRQAHLGAEYTIDTWRMWHTTFDVATGSHKVTVRATDKTGYTQTSDRVDTVPDGATGWHTVSFSAN